MNMRYEQKYIVPRNDLEALRTSLLPYVTLDPFAARKKDKFYTIRSIYLDTPGLRSYREKLEGVKVRRKYRIRGYDAPADAHRVFLEIKQKVDQVGFKYRCQLPAKDLCGLLETREVERFILPEPDTEQAFANAHRFLFGLERGGMMPVMLVVYEREAFVGSIDSRVRITFDYNLRCAPLPEVSRLFDETELRSVVPGLAVVEIKFDRYYGPWLKSIVNDHALVRTSMSKYASCVCASRDIAPILQRSVIREEHASIMGRTEAFIS